ncbi:MAG: hypothetical protein JNJ85_01740 [Candidatus Kapabacteria bacterium]|nr:hypothetical protein [Candidatus Kapabacteria bacterium]
MKPIVLNDTPFVKKMQTYGLIGLVVGLVGLGATFAMDSRAFWGGYLLGFIYFMGISVTMMFFSTLSYLVNAGWAVAVRRIAELYSFHAIWAVPVLMLPLIIPVLTGNSPVYSWVNPTDAHLKEMLEHGFKGVYLAKGFFIVRMVLYIALWFIMNRFIVGNSIKQDTATDITPTAKNWKRAALFTIIYALTITFISFDLVMSLEPKWFSTIFGVTAFAGNFISTCALVLITMNALKQGGYVKGVFSREHYHDLGKLMFAFTIFWTYVNFSQYFIIWYANMPEETFFYDMRLNNGWQLFGWGSLIVHFVIPFLFLIRQDIKRTPKMVRMGALWILFAHFVDLSWIILPVFTASGGEHGAAYHLNASVILAGLCGVALNGGVFLYIASMQYKKYPVIAYNDPYLHETLEYSSGSYDRI